MSETIKLIIEIPKAPKNDHERWVLAHGTLLDDIKAEIEQKAWDTQEVDGEHDNYKVVEVSDVLEIIDKIGKRNKE